MKILLVTEASSAGVGRHVIDLGQGLAGAGCEVHIAYSPLRIDERFRDGLNDPRLSSSLAVAMHRGPHPADFMVVRALRKYLKQNGPFDIVHGHSSKGGAVARLAAIGSKASVAYTPHAFVTMDPQLGFGRRFSFLTAEWLLAPLADAIIAVSQDERDEIVRAGIDERRMRVVHNGIAPPQFADGSEMRRRFGIDPNALVIGFIGRFAPQKDPLLLVDAFAKIAPRHPAAVVVMAGDGPLREPVRRRAAAAGLSDRVLTVGSVPANDILPTFDLFALPSLYEGMPYVLVEAVHAGLPIVATAVASASLVVQDGHSGTIVSDRSPESFAAAIDSLLADTAKRLAFSQATKAHAEQFTDAAMLGETLAVYHALRGLEESHGQLQLRENASSTNFRAVATD